MIKLRETLLCSLDYYRYFDFYMNDYRIYIYILKKRCKHEIIFHTCRTKYDEISAISRYNRFDAAIDRV